MGCLLPSLTTSTSMLLFSLDSSKNCLLCLKLLTADTARTSTTATTILPPSYHPSFMPCCLIPNPRDSAAHNKSIMMVGSLKASSRKLTKLLTGAFLSSKFLSLTKLASSLPSTSTKGSRSLMGSISMET